MLDKLGGTYAPRPSPGPHKLRECLPLTVSLILQSPALRTRLVPLEIQRLLAAGEAPLDALELLEEVRHVLLQPVDELGAGEVTEDRRPGEADRWTCHTTDLHP